VVERLAALVIEGDVGVGKSTLCLEAVRAAEDRDDRVLACRPTESEAGIGFAGLIDLLGPWWLRRPPICLSHSVERSMLP
jgi:hypothetical protein